MGTHSDRRAIILAGGERTRLKPLIQRILGYAAPLQFCRILNDASILERTRQRVALAIPAQQTLIVVTKTHRGFYRPLLSDLPPSAIVAQPQDRGSATAILVALLRSVKVAPATAVAIFPSDHYIEDDAAFMRHVDLAFDGVRARPDLLVLLGITPDGPEAEYCWIEMGERIAEYFQLFRIKKFWQRPSFELAARLWRSGCLWNSFVTVSRISTALDLFMNALPEHYASFASIKSEIGTASESRALERAYADIPNVNLSDEVLAHVQEHLTVLPISGVKWSNLEEPKRLMAMLRGLGREPWDDHE